MAGHQFEKCYACDRAFRKNSYGRIVYHPEVLTIDGQRQLVGYDCFRKISDAGGAGYQPPLGGPMVWAEHYAPEAVLRAAGITRTEGPQR